LNGEFRTPAYSTLEGMNILSRTKDKEYFKVFSDGEDILQKINTFTQEFSMNESFEKIILE
jgi:hypothetical protein